MRLYASAVMQPMLPAWTEYVQYAHPVDEALLQHLEQAGQPVPAMAAFLRDDLAIMVVEGLLDQIELMKRQHISVLEQIECVGKCKAPMFKEPMVEPKQARAPSQHPQELVWAPARTIVQLPPRPLKLASGASTSRSVRMDPVPLHQVQELDILAEPMAELSLEASDHANQTVAFEYSSQQQVKMPASLVYKFAPRGFPHTPYELEWLYKHYANKHAPHCDRVVTYLLINELLLVA
ncbi:hypothetical protein C0995_008699 [Termitomyces sp. Mi166|nr:hypothetical protein C0995_008699 [Termitomyces sp. Mi166\